MNIGCGFVLGEGQVGYFSEGLAYGPQEDLLGTAKPGERLQARSGRGMEIIPYQNFSDPASSDLPLGDRERHRRRAAHH